MIISPLRVAISKNKHFILNLNNYRNAHYMVLNNSKRAYKAILKDQVMLLPKYTTAIKLRYVLFPKTRRRTDIGNVLSIHQKYFEDALTEFNRITDDNYEYIPHTSQFFGAVDKNNPRVEIYISEL